MYVQILPFHRLDLSNRHLFGEYVGGGLCIFYLPYLVIASVRLRNVIEMIRLLIQFVAVAHPLPKLLAHMG